MPSRDRLHKTFTVTMMVIRRYLMSLFIVLSIGWAAYMLYPSYTEHKKTQKELRDLEKSLLAQQKMNENLLKINHKLKSDPRMVERIAREKFGWSRAGEKIYDFTDQKPHGARNSYLGSNDKVDR